MEVQMEQRALSFRLYTTPKGEKQWQHREHEGGYLTIFVPDRDSPYWPTLPEQVFACVDSRTIHTWRKGASAGEVRTVHLTEELPLVLQFKLGGRYDATMAVVAQAISTREDGWATIFVAKIGNGIQPTENGVWKCFPRRWIATDPDRQTRFVVVELLEEVITPRGERRRARKLEMAGV